MMRINTSGIFVLSKMCDSKWPVKYSKPKAIIVVVIFYPVNAVLNAFPKANIKIIADFYYFCAIKMICQLFLFTTMQEPIILPLRGFTPKIGKNCFIAPNATIIGDVEIGDNCSIWFGAVLRGDVNSIRIGNNCNIQDGAVLHTTYERSKVIMGNNVSVGHNATIHGAIIKDDVLIGMGSTVLDNAVIESNVIVAANALITAGTQTEANSIYAGVPAKKIKDLSPEKKADTITRIADNYHLYASWYTGEK